MKKIKVIIVDDEKLARQEIRFLLSEFNDFEIIGEAENVDDAKEQIESLKPDVIFLDISMPEKDGFDLLAELEYIPFVIFLTAYDEFAVRAFEENAFDYLLKPTSTERLQKCLARLQEEIESVKSTDKELKLPKKVFLKDGDKCFFVLLNEIFLIESQGNYAKIHFNKNTILIHRSLNDMQARLDDSQFFRANRQQIFNVDFVAKIDNYYKGGLRVTLQTSHVIEVSNRNAVLFKERMSL